MCCMSEVLAECKNRTIEMCCLYNSMRDTIKNLCQKIIYPPPPASWTYYFLPDLHLSLLDFFLLLSSLHFCGCWYSWNPYSTFLNPILQFAEVLVEYKIWAVEMCCLYNCMRDTIKTSARELFSLPCDMFTWLDAVTQSFGWINSHYYPTPQFVCRGLRVLAVRDWHRIEYPSDYRIRGNSR